MSKHSTKTICPRCEVNYVNHVHCENQGCAFHVHTCDACDRAQAVDAFMADHAKDCGQQKPANKRSVLHRAPSVAA